MNFCKNKRTRKMEENENDSDDNDCYHDDLKEEDEIYFQSWIESNLKY